jgi:hypothetical protein
MWCGSYICTCIGVMWYVVGCIGQKSGARNICLYECGYVFIKISNMGLHVWVNHSSPVHKVYILTFGCG